MHPWKFIWKRPLRNGGHSALDSQCEIPVQLLQLCIGGWSWIIMFWWIIHNNGCRSENKTTLRVILPHGLTVISLTTFLDWHWLVLIVLIPMFNFVPVVCATYLVGIQQKVLTDITSSMNTHFYSKFCSWQKIATFWDLSWNKSTMVFDITATYSTVIALSWQPLARKYNKQKVNFKVLYVMLPLLQYRCISVNLLSQLKAINQWKCYLF